eukprot:g3741.t1
MASTGTGVATWLAKVKPGLENYADIFLAETYDDTKTIFTMETDDIEYMLGKCDAKGITRGLRSSLKKALENKEVFNTQAVEEKNSEPSPAASPPTTSGTPKMDAVRSSAATAASAAAAGAASLIEEGVDTVVDNLQETGEAVDLGTGAIDETEELNETVTNVVNVVLGEEATAVLGDALEIVKEALPYAKAAVKAIKFIYERYSAMKAVKAEL